MAERGVASAESADEVFDAAPTLTLLPAVDARPNAPVRGHAFLANESTADVAVVALMDHQPTWPVQLRKVWDAIRFAVA